jgi:hypothetical protein
VENRVEIHGSLLFFPQLVRHPSSEVSANSISLQTFALPQLIFPREQDRDSVIQDRRSVQQDHLIV